MNQEFESLGDKVRLIISDIDGTLLNSRREISDETIKVIQEARTKGILFSICTGRIATMTEWYVEKLCLTTPIIAANGALIWDPLLKKPVHDVPMDQDEVLEILEFCKFLHMDYSALTLETSYFSESSIRMKRFTEYNIMAKKNGIREMRVDYFDEEHHCIKGLEVYKILIHDSENKQLKKIHDFIKRLKQTGYTSSEPGLIDVSEIRVNKGYGLMKLTEYLGLATEETCAFGDYLNDIPMLKNAGFPVAMGNSCADLKKYAKLVTKTNDENGVAWAIKKYII